MLLLLMTVAYVAVLTVLIIMSLGSRWPYPSVLPEAWQSAAWAGLVAAPMPLMLSVGLAIACALAGVALAVVWFETMAQRHDRLLLGAAAAALALPALVTAAGLYRALLNLGLAGTLAGLFIAHLMPVAAYCLIVLNGPYRAFDSRFRDVAMGLNCSGPRFWLTVKVPLLRAPLLMAAAIGFSVSLVQFVPAQLIAAGRYSTLPMEAVSLSAGGDRALTATYALALAMPQAVVFLIAALMARPRWGRA
jgi:putative thiamine transport system permease protein